MKRLVLLLLFLTSAGVAQPDMYTEYLAGARSSSLGQVMLPQVNGIADAALNPAALARLSSVNAGILYSPFENGGENIGVGIGLPLHPNAGIGVMSFRNRIGITIGRHPGERKKVMAAGSAILVSFARTFLQGKLSVGLGLKTTMFDFEKPVSTGVGVNVGVGYKLTSGSPLLKKAEIGCAVDNLATLFYDNAEDEPLPTYRTPLRAGLLFYKPVDMKRGQLNFIANLSYFELDDAVRLHGGVEAVFASILYVRGGLFSDQYMLGAAVNYKHILLEYAWHSRKSWNAFNISPYQHLFSASFHL